MRWVLMPFRRALDYSGRSGKKEFFSFFWVFLFAIPMAFAVIYPATQGYDASSPSASSDWALSAVGIYFLAILAVTIPLIVRRFHDADFSGWWLLMVLVPLAGAVALVALAMWFQSTPGPNRFGAEPSGGRH